MSGKYLWVSINKSPRPVQRQHDTCCQDVLIVQLLWEFTWMLQYGIQWYYHDTVTAFKFWTWFLSWKRWVCPLRRILRRQNDRWLWRRKGLRRMRGSGTLGDLKLNATGTTAWMIMNDWITNLHSTVDIIWYYTTQVEIPLTFKKVRDVSKASKRNGCSDKLLLGLCRNSWRDVEGNWSWHCTCRYYMYMIYALCRVFSHHLNTQK